MDANRLVFLKAMGIDVWIRRDLVDQESDTSPSDPVIEEIQEELVSEHAFDSGPETEVDQSLVVDQNDDWGTLEERVLSCVRCDLHETRTQAVFGVGNKNADWLIIGEAPGAEEDRQGEPFVGRAGQLLNSMLLAIDLKREQVFIANILKCRPPNNRDPRPEEVACCEPYLRRQIELIQPKIILCVGRIAAQNLLKVDTPIGRMRGKKYTYEPMSIPVVVTYHPAYLLRSPAQKSKSWDDLLFAQSIVEEVAE